MSNFADRLTVFSTPECGVRGLPDSEDALFIFDTRDQLIDFRAADAIKEVQWNIVRARHDIDKYLYRCRLAGRLMKYAMSL